MSTCSFFQYNKCSKSCNSKKKKKKKNYMYLLFLLSQRYIKSRNVYVLMQVYDHYFLRFMNDSIALNHGNCSSDCNFKKVIINDWLGLCSSRLVKME